MVLPWIATGHRDSTLSLWFVRQNTSLTIFLNQLGTQVYGNSTIFIEDTLSVPGPQEVNVLHIVHDCNQIVFHWQFIGVGGPQSVGRVQGFSLLIVDDVSRVTEYYVEFNSYTWALNIGYEIIPAPYEKRSLKGAMPWKA